MVRRRVPALAVLALLAGVVGCGSYGAQEPSGADAGAATDAGGDASVGSPDSGGSLDADVAADSGGDLPDAGPDAVADAGPGCRGKIDCERVVFVTSAQFYPDTLGSVTGADQKCTDAAKAADAIAAVKDKPFRAWLSMGTESPATRLVKGTKEYRRTDGAVIATSWGAFASTAHTNVIVATEIGTTVGGAAGVWTGTSAVGGATGIDCNGWSTRLSGTAGTIGTAGSFDGGWSFYATQTCDNTNRLYCVEE